MFRGSVSPAVYHAVNAVPLSLVVAVTAAAVEAVVGVGRVARQQAAVSV